jgi:hypothetical protein
MKFEYYKRLYKIAVYDYSSKELVSTFKNTHELSSWCNKKEHNIYVKLTNTKNNVLNTKQGKYYFFILPKETLVNANCKHLMFKKYKHLTNFLTLCGLPINIKGFEYIESAIKNCDNFENFKEVIQFIADKNNDKPNNIERCMTYIVKTYWKHIYPNVKDYFYEDYSTPSLKLFIKTLKYIYEYNYVI